MIKTNIDVSGTNKEIGTWVWKNLVPQQGQSACIQGELIRCIERLCWEAQGNGNGNWDNGFIIMLDFLEEKLGGYDGFSFDELNSIKRDISRLRNSNSPYMDDDLYDRLEDFVIYFIKENPICIPHIKNVLLNR